VLDKNENIHTNAYHVVAASGSRSRGRFTGTHSKNHQSHCKDSCGRSFWSLLKSHPSTLEASSLRPAIIASLAIQRAGTSFELSVALVLLPPPLVGVDKRSNKWRAKLVEHTYRHDTLKTRPLLHAVVASPWSACYRQRLTPGHPRYALCPLLYRAHLFHPIFPLIFGGLDIFRLHLNGERRIQVRTSHDARPEQEHDENNICGQRSELMARACP